MKCALLSPRLIISISPYIKCVGIHVLLKTFAKRICYFLSTIFYHHQSLSVNYNLHARPHYQCLVILYYRDRTYRILDFLYDRSHSEANSRALVTSKRGTKCGSQSYLERKEFSTSADYKNNCHVYSTISYAYCNYSNYFYRRSSSGICYISRLWLKLNWSLRRIKALFENRPSTQIFAEASFFNRIYVECYLTWKPNRHNSLAQIAEKLLDRTGRCNGVALCIFHMLFCLLNRFVMELKTKNK